MEDEKKYKEALERARKIHNDTEFDYEKGMMEEVFPELSESEGVKIRKELINYFIKGKEYLSLCSFSKEEILAWLEKQGEKKVSYTTLVETGNGGINALVTKELPTNGCNEQKLAWSEEDEKILNTTISFLSEYAAKGYENAVMCMDWLKSLKDRIGG